MDVILEANNLCKTYGKGEASIQALKDVSVCIKRGEFISVIGPSGSGKSTLLHLVGGLDEPDSGSVIIESNNIYQMNKDNLAIFRRRRFGFVFQTYNLIPVLSVHENILLPLILEGNAMDMDHIDEIIRILGLQDLLCHFPQVLSGGQQQRVAVARALANKPSMLFADEPTGSLDTNKGREMMELLRIMQRRYHQTLIIVTHDMSIARTADRIITIRDGRLVDNIGGNQSV